MSRGADIERVRREGKSLRTNRLLVRVSASPLASPRVGIIVPRYGHSAVDRNKLKRRLRELVRHHVIPLGIGGDLAVWAQRASYLATFDDLRSDLLSLLPRVERALGKET